MLLILCKYMAHGLLVEDLLPFGLANGDTALFRNDDGFTGPIPISVTFPFFHQSYSSLFINTNGLISFDAGVSEYAPNPFPLRNIIGVSPYWTDIDIRYSGDVFYREILDFDLLNDIGIEIRRAFPTFYNFRPTWAYISTWHQVPEYDKTDSQGRLVNNTFQSVVATNGQFSFTIYNYVDLMWPQKGTDRKAQAGFNAGDGITYYTINGSFTQSIVNLTRQSNVGIDGKWIFRVDTANITSGGCSTSGYLTIRPSTIFYIGGTDIHLSGPCFTPEDRIQVSYDSNDSVKYECTVDQSVSLIDSCKCPVPFLNKIGRIPLRLIVNNENTFTGWLNSKDQSSSNEIQGYEAIYIFDQLSDEIEVNFTWADKYKHESNSSRDLRR